MVLLPWYYYTTGRLDAPDLSATLAGEAKEKKETATATNNSIGASRETAPGQPACCSGDCTAANRSPRGPVISSSPEQRLPPWRTPKHKPDALLPYEFRHSAKEWSALESYDKWRRGGVLDELGENEYGYTTTTTTMVLRDG